ncbi:hypothetical protein EST38_g11143 [Candolleomyces aberdarensis]|uniref:Uncharacterized protein n=1 Tax=Candolleomyces aberdarensis TaxID=2316362 RepID=A0A4Q2D5J9_9AGAR|nr:hypothetical protein EST38_g11143 [Candolleomyces aberdarensis]
MQPTGILAILGALAAFASQASANPTYPALVPRASPQPCPQRYVCPEPKPYPNTPDTGDDPGPDRFKCRIGQSAGDPNFAFCIYEKETGNLAGSTPTGLESICWDRGTPNPECSVPSRRALPVRRRSAEPQQLASPVSMERFAKAKKREMS